MTKEKTTSQKRAELKRISKAAKDGVWNMLRLADEILSDHEYVDRFGSEAELIDQMETDEFSHFGGNPKLSAMLKAYRANPGHITWQEYHFNIWAMIELATPAPQPRPHERTDWKKIAQEAEAKVAETKAENQRLERLAAQWQYNTVDSSLPQRPDETPEQHATTICDESAGRDRKIYTDWKKRAIELEAENEELRAENEELRTTLADYKSLVASMRASMQEVLA